MLVDTGVYREGIRCASPGLTEIRSWLDADAGLVWVGLRSPTQAEFALVREAFDLPDASVPLALGMHRQPSFTSLGTTSCLILRTAKHNRSLEKLTTGEVSVFFAERYVVTVRYGDASRLDQVRARLELLPDVPATGVSGVLYAIIDQVVGDYIPVLHDLEHDVLAIEREVFSEDPGSTKRIFALKREVLDLYGLVDTLSDPLNRLIRTREGWMTADARERFQDLDDQVARLSNRTRSLSDLLSSALDAHLAQVSVRQNEDMRRISACAAIVAIPTLVAGFYGMNFEHMPELKSRYGYPVMVAGTFAACYSVFRWFRRNGWL